MGEKADKTRRYNEIKEFRALEPQENDNKYIIEGYAIVYGERTKVGNHFYEIIKHGALDGADLTDVPFFIHHESRRVPLARSRNNNGNSTMTLIPDDRGLFFTAELDVENNAEARALYSAVKRGDITGMSYAFTVKEQIWKDLNLDNKMPTREIVRFNKIFEISALWSPQYEGTNISARDGELDSSDKKALESALSTLESEKRERELEQLRLRTLLKFK